MEATVAITTVAVQTAAVVAGQEVMQAMAEPGRQLFHQSRLQLRAVAVVEVAVVALYMLGQDPGATAVALVY
jgi:hypothetical protein